MYRMLTLCFVSMYGFTHGYAVNKTDPSEGSTVAFCTSYCDVYGYYQPQKYCVSQDGSIVYCCGSENNRYCCTDKNKDVGDMYPNVKQCPNSGYWSYQWKIIIGLLGSLIVMLSLAACCFYCCGSKTVDRGRRNQRRARRRAELTDANGNRVEPGPDIIIEEFDPESPYAFSPPEYDSLPKDPPKYLDICGDGQENAAFQEEHEMTDMTSSSATTPSPSATTLSPSEQSSNENSPSHDRDSGISLNSEETVTVHEQNSTESESTEENENVTVQTTARVANEETESCAGAEDTENTQEQLQKCSNEPKDTSSSTNASDSSQEEVDAHANDSDNNTSSAQSTTIVASKAQGDSTEPSPEEVCQSARSLTSEEMALDRQGSDLSQVEV